MIINHKNTIAFKGKRKANGSILLTGVNGLNNANLKMFREEESRYIKLSDTVMKRLKGFSVDEEIELIGKISYSIHHGIMCSDTSIDRVRIVKNTEWKPILLLLRGDNK